MNSPAPTCATCGYSLIGLTEFRCPECGTPFTSQDLERAATIQLPWNDQNQPLLVRLFKTILLAWFKPHVYFSTAAQNPARPLRAPGRFILACIVLSVGIELCGYIMGSTFFFAKLLNKGAGVQRALYAVFHAMTFDTSIMISSLLLGDALAQVIAIVCIIWLLKRCKNISIIGKLVALFVPALPLNSLLTAIGRALVSIDMRFVMFPYVMMPIYSIFLAICTWFCCRKLFQFRRLTTCVSIILSFIVYFYGFSPALSSIYSKLFLTYLKMKGVQIP